MLQGKGKGQERAASGGRGSEARPKRRGCGRIGCALAAWLLLMGVGFGLNELGVIDLPFLPRVFGLVKKPPAPAAAETEAAAGEDEALTQEEAALAEGVGGAEEATPADETEAGASGRAAAVEASRAPSATERAPEEKATKQAQQRLQRVADIVGELSPESAVATLGKMPLEEQVSIIRLLDDKDVGKVLEAMDADTRVDVLRGLAQPPGARVLSPSETEEAPEKGETARRSLLSLPLRTPSGAE